MKIFEKLKEIFRKPKPPKKKKEAVQPEPMLQATQSLAAAGLSAEEAAYAIAKVIAQKPEPLRHLTNNWRKMHGLPMRRKAPKQRRR